MTKIGNVYRIAVVFIESRDGSVGIATGYIGWTSDVRLQAKENYFSTPGLLRITGFLDFFHRPVF
jgi:hypothetical protein